MFFLISKDKNSEKYPTNPYLRRDPLKHFLMTRLLLILLLACCGSAAFSRFVYDICI